MTTDPKQLSIEAKLKEIVYRLYNGAYMNANKPLLLSEDMRYTQDAISALESLTRETAKQRETELLDALYWMYSQYCKKEGHLFMGAGETASEILENAGYITCDSAGRVTKDNGDSYMQNIPTNPTQESEKQI